MNAAHADDRADDLCLFALYVDTDAGLANVLNVTPPAVAKAERDGRIAREDDGRWEVFAVLHAWRANTWAGLQRNSGAWRPWFNTGVSLDSDAVMNALIARTRLAGGTVSAQYNRGQPWLEVPDPIVLLRTGTQIDRVDPKRSSPPIADAALCELHGLVRWAGEWLQHVDVLAGAAANACGVPLECVHPALEEEVRIHLAFLAQREREMRCPPDPSRIDWTRAPD